MRPNAGQATGDEVLRHYMYVTGHIDLIVYDGRDWENHEFLRTRTYMYMYQRMMLFCLEAGVITRFIH